MLTQLQITTLTSFLRDNKSIYLEELQHDTSHLINKIRFQVLGDEAFFKNLNEVTDITSQIAGEKLPTDFHYEMKLCRSDALLYKDELTPQDLKSKYLHLASKDNITLSVNASRAWFAPSNDFYTNRSKENMVIYSVKKQSGHLKIASDSSLGVVGSLYGIGYFLERAQKEGVKTVSFSFDENIALTQSLVGPLENLMAAFGFASGEIGFDALSISSRFMRAIIDFKAGAEMLLFTHPSISLSVNSFHSGHEELEQSQSVHAYTFIGYGLSGLLSMSKQEDGTRIHFHGLYEDEGFHLVKLIPDGQSFYAPLVEMVSEIKEKTKLATLLEPPVLKTSNFLGGLTSDSRELMDFFVSFGYGFEEIENTFAMMQTDFIHCHYRNHQVPKELVADSTVRVNFVYRMPNHYFLRIQDTSDSDSTIGTAPFEHFLFENEEELNNFLLTKKKVRQL